MRVTEVKGETFTGFHVSLGVCCRANSLFQGVFLGLGTRALNRPIIGRFGGGGALGGFYFAYTNDLPLGPVIVCVSGAMLAVRAFQAADGLSVLNLYDPVPGQRIVLKV